MAASGGAKGSGGSTASGGADGSGGAGGTGGSQANGSGGSASGASGFTVDVSLSTAIPTVGIVTWSLAGSEKLDSAVVDFGRDQANFEFQAPVDLGQSDHRTLLLGMKQMTTYYVRVTAKAGGNSYVSDVATVKTGALPNGLLPAFTKTDMDASSLYAGGAFTVNCIGLGGSPGLPGQSGKSVAFIFDKDGDIVWGLDLTSTAATNCSRARMSYDGQSLLAGNFANASTSGALFQIGMDGMGSGQSWKLPGRSHDFGVLPNGHIMYFATDNMMANTVPGLETVWELDPSSGKMTMVYQEQSDFAELVGAGNESHTNHIAFSPELGAITISMLIPSTIAVVSYPDAKLLEVFGGAQSHYSNMNWTWQHGHDIHRDHIWVFNNNKSGDAHVLGFKYDSSAKTATPTLDYDPGLQNTTFGDVKELPNGNLYITYSDTGGFHEITSTGTLLRKITTTTAVGYSEHRATLYGPPPPFDKN